MAGPYGTDRTILAEGLTGTPYPSGHALDSPIQRLLQPNSMTTSMDRPISKACVPVSTTASRLSNRPHGSLVLVGQNKAHMKRLVGVLVHTYGWTLGQDGNLYSPNPVETAWGDRVA
jgi:hypothetical protein